MENIEPKDVKKMLSETLDANPSPTTLNILKFEDLHKKAMLNEFNPFISWFEDYFHRLVGIDYGLNYVDKKQWNNTKNIVFVLLSEILKSLHRAFEDTCSGYYAEACIVLRTVYETYIRMIYCICFPENYEAIFFDIAGKPQFQVTNFVRDILKIDWEFIYRILSYYAHSNKLRYLAILEDLRKGKKEPISLVYYFNKEEVSRPMNMILFLFYGIQRLALSLYREDLKNDLFKQHMEVIYKSNEVLREFLKDTPNRMNETITGVDRIDEIIKDIDEGKDWRNRGDRGT